LDKEQKKAYLDKYHREKEHGEKFWPDSIYKDLLVSFAIFLLLVGLTAFIGVANEPRADPSDSSYIPRPEWYFLFLFQMLKYIPPKLEWVGTAVIPTVAVLALLLLPFYDRSPFRYWKKRKFAIVSMTVVVLGMVALTIVGAATTPPEPTAGTAASTISDQIAAGQDLFSINCVNCHGPNGEGGEIIGVEGLEGRVIKAINSKDEMYTRDDQTLANIISYGQPDLGMTPFGKGYGGPLLTGDINSIVTFMRYSWDDRVELPTQTGNAIPTLAPDQVPSYDVYVAPIFKRNCVSCHRPGQKNNNYLMGSYQEVMTTGDHTPNVKPFDPNSNMLLMLQRQKIEAGGPMPPTHPLDPNLFQIIYRWIMGGAPQTADQANSATPVGGTLSPGSTPAQGGTPAPGATPSPAVTPAVSPTP
jgi:menaquinol-cytochrome c reductase cytochrome b/c subunit